MLSDPIAPFVRLAELAAPCRTALLLLCCALLGAAGGWLIATVPFRKKLMDAPNARSSHTIPTPRGGGVGILAAFTLAGLTLRIPATFLSAAILISAVSFYGDYVRISVRLRLALQTVCGVIFLLPLLTGANAPLSPFLAGLPPFMVIPAAALTFLFVIGTANFFNFMDGIDGIAGLSGAIGFGLLGLFGILHFPGDSLRTALSLLAVCVSLACLGYLPFNMPRARVFMGDVGSILLGFVFAGLAVLLSRNWLETACFASLLFPFYADELTTIVVRVRDRENLFRPHRRHLYQILANELGVAHWIVAALYGAAQLIVGLAALAACSRGAWPLLILLASCFAFFIALTAHVRRIVRS